MNFYFVSESLVSASPPNVSAPVPEEEALVLMEGAAKGGHPVDLSSQSTADLTSICQPEVVCASALLESELEPAAIAQLEARYPVLETQDDFLPSITEVIRPMEMAELVDILPTLSVIEEENPSAPPTPSVLDMLKSFGLGIGENSTIFDLNSELVDGGVRLSQPNSSSVSVTHCENTEIRQEDAVAAASDAGGGEEPVSSCGFPTERETRQVSSTVVCFPVRNQVEWDRPSNGLS